MNTLDPFINDLLEEKGYADALPEVKETLQKDLKIRIDEFIMARTIAAFSDEDLKAFETMLDEKKSRAELQQFAVDHIPDYTTFLASTLVEFQDVFLCGKLNNMNNGEGQKPAEKVATRPLGAPDREAGSRTPTAEMTTTTPLTEFGLASAPTPAPGDLLEVSSTGAPASKDTTVRLDPFADIDIPPITFGATPREAPKGADGAETPTAMPGSLDTTFADGTLPTDTHPDSLPDTATGTAPLRETDEKSASAAADAAPIEDSITSSPAAGELIPDAAPITAESDADHVATQTAAIQAEIATVESPGSTEAPIELDDVSIFLQQQGEAGAMATMARNERKKQAPQKLGKWEGGWKRAFGLLNKDNWKLLDRQTQKELLAYMPGAIVENIVYGRSRFQEKAAGALLADAAGTQQAFSSERKQSVAQSADRELQAQMDKAVAESDGKVSKLKAKIDRFRLGHNLNRKKQQEMQVALVDVAYDVAHDPNLYLSPAGEEFRQKNPELVAFAVDDMTGKFFTAAQMANGEIGTGLLEGAGLPITGDAGQRLKNEVTRLLIDHSEGSKTTTTIEAVHARLQQIDSSITLDQAQGLITATEVTSRISDELNNYRTGVDLTDEAIVAMLGEELTANKKGQYDLEQVAQRMTTVNSLKIFRQLRSEASLTVADLAESDTTLVTKAVERAKAARPLKATKDQDIRTAASVQTSGADTKSYLSRSAATRLTGVAIAGGTLLLTPYAAVGSVALPFIAARLGYKIAEKRTTTSLGESLVVQRLNQVRHGTAVPEAQKELFATVFVEGITKGIENLSAGMEADPSSLAQVEAAVQYLGLVAGYQKIEDSMGGNNRIFESETGDTQANKAVMDVARAGLQAQLRGADLTELARRYDVPAETPTDAILDAVIARIGEQEALTTGNELVNAAKLQRQEFIQAQAKKAAKKAALFAAVGVGAFALPAEIHGIEVGIQGVADLKNVVTETVSGTPAFAAENIAPAPAMENVASTSPIDTQSLGGSSSDTVTTDAVRVGTMGRSAGAPIQIEQPANAPAATVEVAQQVQLNPNTAPTSSYTITTGEPEWKGGTGRGISLTNVNGKDTISLKGDVPYVQFDFNTKDSLIVQTSKGPHGESILAPDTNGKFTLYTGDGQTTQIDANAFAELLKQQKIENESGNLWIRAVDVKTVDGKPSVTSYATDKVTPQELTDLQNAIKIDTQTAPATPDTGQPQGETAKFFATHGTEDIETTFESEKGLGDNMHTRLIVEDVNGKPTVVGVRVDLTGQTPGQEAGTLQIDPGGDKDNPLLLNATVDKAKPGTSSVDLRFDAKGGNLIDGQGNPVASQDVAKLIGDQEKMQAYIEKNNIKAGFYNVETDNQPADQAMLHVAQHDKNGYLRFGDLDANKKVFSSYATTTSHGELPDTLSGATVETPQQNAAVKIIADASGKISVTSNGKPVNFTLPQGAVFDSNLDQAGIQNATDTTENNGGIVLPDGTIIIKESNFEGAMTYIIKDVDWGTKDLKIDLNQGGTLTVTDQTNVNRTLTFNVVDADNNGKGNFLIPTGQGTIEKIGDKLVFVDKNSHIAMITEPTKQGTVNLGNSAPTDTHTYPNAKIKYADGSEASFQFTFDSDTSIKDDRVVWRAGTAEAKDLMSTTEFYKQLHFVREHFGIGDFSDKTIAINNDGSWDIRPKSGGEPIAHVRLYGNGKEGYIPLYDTPRLGSDGIAGKILHEFNGKLTPFDQDSQFLAIAHATQENKIQIDLAAKSVSGNASNTTFDITSLPADTKPDVVRQQMFDLQEQIEYKGYSTSPTIKYTAGTNGVWTASDGTKNIFTVQFSQDGKMVAFNPEGTNPPNVQTIAGHLHVSPKGTFVLPADAEPIKTVIESVSKTPPDLTAIQSEINKSFAFLGFKDVTMKNGSQAGQYIFEGVPASGSTTKQELVTFAVINQGGTITYVPNTTSFPDASFKLVNGKLTLTNNDVVEVTPIGPKAEIVQEAATGGVAPITKIDTTNIAAILTQKQFIIGDQTTGQQITVTADSTTTFTGTTLADAKIGSRAITEFNADLAKIKTVNLPDGATAVVGADGKMDIFSGTTKIYDNIDASKATPNNPLGGTVTDDNYERKEVNGVWTLQKKPAGGAAGTPTGTPTPSPTATATPSSTATPTPTSTGAPTPSATATPTPISTTSPEMTPTPATTTGPVPAEAPTGKLRRVPSSGAEAPETSTVGSIAIGLAIVALASTPLLVRALKNRKARSRIRRRRGNRRPGTGPARPPSPVSPPPSGTPPQSGPSGVL